MSLRIPNSKFLIPNCLVRITVLVWKELIELKEDPDLFGIVIVAPILAIDPRRAASWWSGSTRRRTSRSSAS